MEWEFQGQEKSYVLKLGFFILLLHFFIFLPAVNWTNLVNN